MKSKNITLLAIFVTLLTFTGLTQLPPVTVCLGTDTTVCQNQSISITNCIAVGGSGVLNLPSPSSVSLSDDSWSAAVPIGFTFSYYGINYTQCVIGSNGLVSFKLSNAGGYCPWSLPAGASIPTASLAGASNSAMGIYQDMNPANSSSGPIQYQTIGTAPNRIFAVLYKGVTAFSCTSSCSYIAFLFYEGTNVIEYHIGNKATCSNWNGDRAIQGVQNLAGNIATATAGRNNTIWSASQDGKRFSPTSPTNTSAYSVTTIPYQNVTSSGTAGSGLTWRSTLNQTFPYNGGTLTIASVPAGTTGYFLTGTSCGVSIGSVSDTSFITRSVAGVAATSISDTCAGGNGVMTATPGANPPYTYTWTNISQTTSTVNNVTTGTYTVNALNVHGCPASATVTVANQVSSSTSSNTLVSCPGGTDGTATASMLPVTLSVTYLWNDPASQTSQTAIGLAAGTYDCTVTGSNGCIEIVTVIVSEIPGTIATISNQQDVTCYTGNDGIVVLSVSSGTSPYTYLWSGSTSTSSTANDLYVGAQQVDITDANGCVVTLNTTLAEPMSLLIDSVSTDTVICSESSIMLGVVGSGGSSPYIYTWYENGNLVSTNQYPTVDPLNTGTVYDVVLSEQCGSPTTSASLTIFFPTPIEPFVVPNPFEACAPDTFKFVNTSSNDMEIASTFYQFSNGATLSMNGIDTASLLFPTAGAYDVDMTITSIYGCIYNAYFSGIIAALQRPKALFSLSSNPTTIFETRVKMFDKSIGAIAWQWLTADAIPAVSSSQNPEFFFPQVEGLYPVNLTVTSPLGCWDTITINLNVQSDVLFYAPNTFTPDNDEHNPTWKLSTAGMDLSNFELTVYNRWGEVIWQTFDTTAEWYGTYKGRQVETGMYNWKARYKKFGKEDFRTTTGAVNVLK